MSTKLSTLALLAGMLCSGCIQQIAISSLGGIMDNGFAVLNEEQDLQLANQSIASNLKLLESILRSDPDNAHYLLLASRGYASYSLGFVEDDSTERARLLYLRGRDFGLRILDKNSKFAAARLGNGMELPSAMTSFSKEDVPAIFWTAIAWGSYINLSITDPSALADLSKVETLMRFVVEKDPEYFYGGSHFFLGTLYGSRPKMLGGDPDSSRIHFEECFRISRGAFLLPYVFSAQTYAVQIQDRELFERNLTIVDSTSIDVLPEARLINAIAKRKARSLRAKIDELF